MNLIHPRSYACPVWTAICVDILIPMITTIRRWKCTTAGIGLASIALFGLSDSGLTLEPPQKITQIPVSSGTKTQSNVLFVNPAVENATIGNGSVAAPFKTITQALEVAQPSSVITLSPGTYSTASGETFPLRLKAGVSIQGDRRTKGSKIIINGGGTFLSPTFARQNIAILGANQASLSGVTVTNSNPRGYGLWIESSNLLVSDNTFTGNAHDGLSITGNSQPIIRNNYFHQNGANGMTIYGISRPEVRENVFEKTGFGINIAQKAAPILVGNRISQNRSGIVTQAQSQPILRGNVIEGNTEDGLVAIATSQPNLGTKTQPGGNIFRQNGRFDINGSASKQVISAFGNQLASDRSSGNIDLAGTVDLVASQAIPQLAQNSQAASRNQGKIPVVFQPNPAQLPQSQEIAPIIIPVPPPGSTQDPKPSSSPQLNLIQVNSSKPSQIATGNTKASPASGSDTAIEIPIPLSSSQQLIPPPAQRSGTVSQNLPVLQSAQIIDELLPVPSGNIPIGNSRNQQKVSVPDSEIRASGSPPLPPTRATSLGLRYRVVVEAGTQSRQAFVRSLVPGAFRTFSNGQMLMQVGAFSDRAKADEMLQMVTGKGLKATLEQM